MIVGFLSFSNDFGIELRWDVSIIHGYITSENPYRPVIYNNYLLNLSNDVFSRVNNLGE